MAVRIRADGTIVCAAMSEPQEGDTYLHDGIHHILSGELGVLVSEPMERHQHDGLWWWRGRAPNDRAIEPHFDEVFLEVAARTAT